MSANTHAIVFDWNCTLFDDFEAMFSCTNRLLESEGVPAVAVDDFRARYTIPFKHFYDGMGLDETTRDKLLSLENNLFHDIYEPLANLAGLREGAREIVEHANTNGIETLILSNHIVDPIRTQLTRLGIDHHFTAILAYANRATQFRDMTKGERLRRVMTAREITPRHMMIVGDTVEEVEIARAQNLVSVAITGGCVSEQRLSAAKPDHLIHSLHELISIMQERGFAS